MLKISDNQQNIINSLKNNNIVVDAVAGSGKTTTNIFIGINNPTLSILLLTYNAKLRIETKQKLESQNLKNIECHTYHSFCVKYYNSLCYNDIMLSLNSAYLNTAKYNLIVLDESQDITPDFYKIICKILADNGVAKLCILGDKNQCIYTYAGASPKYLLNANIFFNCNTYNWEFLKLSESFRVPHLIANFVNICMLNEHRIISNKILKHKPKYLICNVYENNEDNKPFKIIKKLLNSGYMPQDIFVLAPSLKKRNYPPCILENLIIRLLPEVPIYVPLLNDEKIDESIIKHKLVFSTFHQSKGLERKVVILYSFDESYYKFFNKSANPNICSNELYVAATRALERLYLVHHYKNNKLIFLNTAKLQEHCKIIKSGYENILTQTLSTTTAECSKIYSVTELTQYLDTETINTCYNLLNINNIIPPAKVINLKSKVPALYCYNGQILHGFEKVHDLNGTALPMYFEWKLTGKIHGVEYKKINIANALFIANSHLYKTSGYLYKCKQIQNYNWISDWQLKKIINRMHNHISAGDFEVKVIHGNLCGAIDCISNGNVYEFKCTTYLSKIHAIQLALYMYINKKNNTEYNYYLFNILSGEIIQVSATMENLNTIFNTLILKK